MPEFPVREEITIEEYFKVFDKYKNIFNSNLTVVAHSIVMQCLLSIFLKIIYRLRNISV